VRALGSFLPAPTFDAAVTLYKSVSAPVRALGSFLPGPWRGPERPPHRVSAPVRALGSFLPKEYVGGKDETTDSFSAREGSGVFSTR